MDPGAGSGGDRSALPEDEVRRDARRAERTGGGLTCETAGGTRTGGPEPRPSSASSSQRPEPPAHSRDPDVAPTGWGGRGTSVWASLFNEEVRVGAAPSFLSQKGKGCRFGFLFCVWRGEGGAVPEEHGVGVEAAERTPC